MKDNGGPTHGSWGCKALPTQKKVLFILIKNIILNLFIKYMFFHGYDDYNMHNSIRDKLLYVFLITCIDVVYLW